jgi:hypothetical protein
MSGISFRVDISILFTDRDVHCMLGKGVDLRSYSYMSSSAGDGAYADHANANHVLAHLEGREQPKMPLGTSWPQADIDKFTTWMSGGYLP